MSERYRLLDSHGVVRRSSFDHGPAERTSVTALPLKAVVRGHSFAVVPISWTNRAAGESKLALNEMGSRYLFIVLYAFLEKHLSRGDYFAGRSREPGAAPSPPPRRMTRFERRRRARRGEHSER